MFGFVVNATSVAMDSAFASTKLHFCLHFFLGNSFLLMLKEWTANKRAGIKIKKIMKASVKAFQNKSFPKSFEAFQSSC